MHLSNIPILKSHILKDKRKEKMTNLPNGKYDLIALSREL